MAQDAGILWVETAVSMAATRRALCVVGATLCFGATAQAVELPSHLAGRPLLELASGDLVRGERVLEWYRVPPHAASTWARLVREMGPSTLAVWDPATGVPSRIWGSGIPVADSVGSAKRAAAFAESFIERHVDLLAPGAGAGDFALVSNDLDAGMRTVGLIQRHAGMRVHGGQLSFRFKNDRLFMIGTEALPHVVARWPQSPPSSASLGTAAQSWLLSDVAGIVKTDSIEGPLVLPLVAARSVRYHTVFAVTVDAEQPLGRWRVYVDAKTAAPVAREQTLRFATGTLLYNAPERWPGGALRIDYPAFKANVTVDTANVTTDALGMLSWLGNANGNVVAFADGTQVRVENVAGPEDSQSLVLPPGGTAVWNASTNETVDAQVSAFVHTNKVIELARTFAGGLPYLDTQVPANVNINNACNAFWNGQSINFYLSSSNCSNTAQLADVVYHEFGHALHTNSIIMGVGSFDGALSEGVSDFLAVTLTGDSGMGRGFYKTNNPLRELEPSSGYLIWPDDIGEIHYTGRIIGGALWDLRKLLIASLGNGPGLAQTNHIYYQAMRRAVDIPTMYPEALAADDNDGDLANGTPNVCEINQAFGNHGLRRVTAQPDPTPVRPPHLDGYDVTLSLTGLYTQCPSDATTTAELVWRRRADPPTGGTMIMTPGPSGFTGTIPAQADGTVVQYQVRLEFADLTMTVFPDNPADRWYEMFIGHVEPIYCTDFETDPALEGWTHGLTSGQQQQGADDWTWGEPLATSTSGDPSAAFSGTRVFGNDLGGGNFNGEYQPDKVNYGQSPMVDVGAYDAVRLQYRRWLNVEDGFFDQANLYANDQLAWTNADSMMGNDSHVHHTDREWRFHDVELTPYVVGGQVAVKFEIDSDGGLELGGWTLDDVCIMGFVPTVCGDGLVTGVEACDDANANSDTEPDACRSDCSAARCGDAVVDTAEECDDGNAVDGDGCSAACAIDSGATSAGAGGGEAVPPLQVEDACGCRMPRDPKQSWAWPLAALAAAAVAARRRRARASR